MVNDSTCTIDPEPSLLGPHGPAELPDMNRETQALPSTSSNGTRDSQHLARSPLVSDLAGDLRVMSFQVA